MFFLVYSNLCRRIPAVCMEKNGKTAGICRQNCRETLTNAGLALIIPCEKAKMETVDVSEWSPREPEEVETGGYGYSRRSLRSFLSETDSKRGRFSSVIWERVCWYAVTGGCDKWTAFVLLRGWKLFLYKNNAFYHWTTSIQEVSGCIRKYQQT